ncbi:Peptide transporter PTR2 [Hordeum vulgare]|nr:Peptide transporter PTR2 [Hordeum vulgare]
MREATDSDAMGASSTRAATGLALMAFLVGMPRYRIFTVQGSSALLEIFRCTLLRSGTGTCSSLRTLTSYTRSAEAKLLLRFLDRAAIVQAPTAETPSPWRQCRVTHVEHAKTVLAMGSTMNTWVGSFQMQPATLPIIPLGMLILVMPIYEHLFVPFARGVTGHPNGIPYLQRVGVGVVLSIVSMCIAVIVEMYRKKVAV